MQHYEMMIDGQAAIADSYVEVLNPATAQAFAHMASGNPSHVDQAVSAASRAFQHWSQLPPAERQAKLFQLADLIEAHMPELMQLVVQETGKPLIGLNQVGAGMEVGGAAVWTRVNSSIELPVEVLQDNDEARVEVHRKPLGVVGSITPWNWPLLIAIWHIIPALKSGNTVVLKPSPLTPISTARLVQLANQVLPAGVLNLVAGGPEIGQAMSEHPDIAKIVFTGSTPTGKHIMRAAAGNLKRLTLELGGNDAGIVLPDVDVKQVAPKLLAACFHNNGQTCAALKRLYVHASIYPAVCDEMARLARELVVGDGLEETTQLGPIQNQKQLEIVEALVEDARQAGGEVLCGGQRMDRPGYFFEPTLVAGLSEGSRLVDEEPFGPVVPILQYHDIEEVIARANASPNGLGSSVWSTDIDAALKVGQRLEAGSLWINDHGAIQPDAPFGGIKQSGFGVEFGRHGLEEFTAIQTVKICK